MGPQSYPSAVSDHSALVSESCVTSTCPSISVVSSRSAISILSVSRSPPHGCDLEVIKKRYIESFKAKVTKGDQRLDCQFVRDTDTKSFSLWISGSCALLLLLVSGLIGIYSREHVSKHWPILLFEVCVGLAFTVLLDTALMTFVAVCRWRIVAHCLASRRDERWRRVAERRKLKAEAMRSVATPAITQDVPGHVTDVQGVVSHSLLLVSPPSRRLEHSEDSVSCCQSTDCKQSAPLLSSSYRSKLSCGACVVSRLNDRRQDAQERSVAWNLRAVWMAICCESVGECFLCVSYIWTQLQFSGEAGRVSLVILVNPQVGNLTITCVRLMLCDRLQQRSQFICLRGEGTDQLLSQ